MVNPRLGSRVGFLDLAFDRLDLAETLAWIAARGADEAFAYIVTPNVDHIVRFAQEPVGSAVRGAYAAAALCLCDSRVLARLARFVGVDLPVVPGSDLTARILRDPIPGAERLCLIGGDPVLVRDLAAMLPACTIVQHIPPMGFRYDAAALETAAAFAAKSGARLILLAVGSPQQELLAHRIAQRPDARGTGLCIGASVEFVTGAKARAPIWMRRLGIEWLHRLASEPRRLWRRYLIEGPRIFLVVLRWRLRR